MKAEMEYAGMKLSVVLVTPVLATEWLTRNTANRRIRNGFVSAYARDMANNVWYPKALAVCFRKDGTLGNGQHTLSAIVQSGTSQLLLIAENCSDESIAAMDRGIKRTIADIARFIGVEMSSQMAAVARALRFGADRLEKGTFDELYETFVEHEDAIRFALEGTSSVRERGVSTAAYLAVIARAYYNVDQQTLARFKAAVLTGNIEGQEEWAATKLRDWFLRNRVADRLARGNAYWLTETALAAFIRKEPLKKLMPSKREQFPLPSEKKAAASARGHEAVLA